MEADDIARLLDKRLREAFDCYLDLVRARFVKRQLHNLARAVKNLKRRDFELPLLASGGNDIRLEGKRLLLANPAACGNDDSRFAFGIVERIANDRILHRKLVGPVGDARHVGPEAEVVEVELTSLRRRVAVAPVVLLDAVELDWKRDRLFVLADGLGEGHLELLPVARQLELPLGVAHRMHGNGEVVRVRVDERELHSPRVIVAETRPAGELDRLSGKDVLLERSVPAAKNVVAVTRLEAHRLRLRRRIGRPLVERNHLATAGNPSTGFPSIHLGITDVARNELGVRDERSHGGKGRQADKSTVHVLSPWDLKGGTGIKRPCRAP